MVQRAFLGIMIRDIDGTLIRDENLKITEGSFVDSMVEKSPARKAGILTGDVITKVNETPIRHSAELLEQIGRHRPGDEVSVTVNRKGEDITYTVQLADQKGTKKLLSKNDQDILDILGASFEELDRNTAGDLGIEGGVRIKELNNGLLKNQTSISEGFIITGVNQNKVKNVDDIRKALKDQDGGVLIQGIYEDYPGEIYFAFGLPE